MNEWVLITGASTGIGAEFARVFASHSYNLVLTARDEGRLQALAAELKAKHDVLIHVVVQDLAAPGAALALAEAVGGVPISILVNNAGFGVFGHFDASDLAKQTSMVQVNVTVLVELTRLFLPKMISQGEGRILNVSSTGAFQPGPFKAIYFATKSFVFSFSHALAEELLGTGVTVTVLCPGVTETEFHQRAGGNPSMGGYTIMSARAVAEIGYEGLMRGKRTVIPGVFNKVLAVAVRFFPSRVAAWGARKVSSKKR